jgi:hypothetical protein
LTESTAHSKRPTRPVGRFFLWMGQGYSRKGFNAAGEFFTRVPGTPLETIPRQGVFSPLVPLFSEHRPRAGVFLWGGYTARAATGARVWKSAVRYQRAQAPWSCGGAWFNQEGVPPAAGSTPDRGKPLLCLWVSWTAFPGCARFSAFRRRRQPDRIPAAGLSAQGFAVLSTASLALPPPATLLARRTGVRTTPGFPQRPTRPVGRLSVGP